MSAVLEKHPWLIYLLPLAVFLTVGSLEPTPKTPGGAGIGLAIPYAWYPGVYTLKILLTVAAVAAVAAGYRQFPFRLSGWAVLVGVAGFFVWIGLCALHLEERLPGPLGDWLVKQGARSGFNPLAELAAMPGWAWTFMAIRFFGFVLLVPLIEEFFLRGWAMRFFVADDWWQSPIGDVNGMALAVGTILPMLSHLGELFAAAVWFSLVTWLMVKTRNIWDCVLAHAITNLLLGVYVVIWGQWQLM
jgi:CAAX prenyl protease-like protein